MAKLNSRKIIHIDMDCFYAAIEIRDNPSLADKPVAVGGSADSRGVLCTCNYLARKFKVRSAMATAYAKKLCPDLIVLPVNFEKYRAVSESIHKIFLEFTDLVEPLSLDEAYLEVTDSPHQQGSATLIAEEIRKRIWQEVNLTASAGVAPNKFLAKIASGWNKPNGIFVIRPQEISSFVKNLKVEELFGVGKVTAEKLHKLNIKTCADLQNIPLVYLTDTFGKIGTILYEQSRGIDNRAVEPNRIRKSLSVERTFRYDLKITEDFKNILDELFQTLLYRIQEESETRFIKNQYLKIKNDKFKVFTIEKSSDEINLQTYYQLFREISRKEKNAIRLLGIGVHFKDGPQQITLSIDK